MQTEFPSLYYCFLNSIIQVCLLLNVIVAERSPLFDFAVLSVWSLKMHKYFGLIKPGVFSEKFAVAVSDCFQSKRHFTTKDRFAKRSGAKNKAAANMTVNMQVELVLFLFPFS